MSDRIEASKAAIAKLKEELKNPKVTCGYSCKNIPKYKIEYSGHDGADERYLYCEECIESQLMYETDMQEELEKRKSEIERSIRGLEHDIRGYEQQIYLEEFKEWKEKENKNV